MDTIPTLLTAYAPAAGDSDAGDIGALYRAGRASMVDSVHHLIEAGRRLQEKKDSLGHGQWLPWLTANEEALGFGHTAATRIMKAARKYCVDATFDDEVEALRLNRVVWGNNVRGTAGTHNDEWFTPSEYIEAARAVLGDIDLDPASSAQAQEIVRAAAFFSKQNNGLVQEWHGRLWVNPPFAQPLIAQFISKLVAERVAGHITAAIVLTHNYTDTAWFHELVSVADAICFTRGRVKFYEGDNIAAPTQGQAFAYLGNDVQRFEDVFCLIGACLRPSRVRPPAAPRVGRSDQAG
jgi:phage N-6-adenine-methyltransferase